MSGPARRGCASTATRDLDARGARASASTMTGTKVERDPPRTASARSSGFVVGTRAERRAAPRRRPAEASARSTSATASPRRSSAARRTSPPGQTVAVARPGRGDARRHEARQGEAARRRVRRDDPRRGRGRASARDARRDHGARRRRRRPARRCAEVLPIADRRARARDHAEPPRLPRRLRRRARGPRRDRRAAGAAAVGARIRGPPGDAAPARVASRSRPSCARASPRACSRTSRSARRRCG